VFPSIALVRRELLTTFRRIRTFVFLVCCVVAVTLPTMLQWFRMPEVVGIEYYLSGGTARAIVDYAAIFLMVGCCLFVPAVASTAFSEERERGTLDQLHMTLISPWGLVTAKCLNAIGFYLTVIIATVPIIATAYFLLGIEWPRLVREYVIILATCVSCAVACVYCSVLYDRTANAVIAAYVAMLLVIGVPITAIALVFELTTGISSNDVINMAEVLSPGFALGSTVMGGMSRLTFAGGLVYHALIVLVFGTLSIVRLKQRLDPVSSPKWHRRLRDAWRYASNSGRYRPPRQRAMPDNRNPVLMRELRWNPANRPRCLIWLFIGACFAYLFAAIALLHARSFPWFNFRFEPVAFWFYFQFGLTLLLTPVFGANVFARECETNNMDMLRSTRLRAREVFWGKAASAALPVAVLLAASACACLVTTTLIRSVRIDQLISGLGTLAVSACVAYALTLLCSVCARRTSVALVLSFSLSLVVFLVGFGAAHTAVRMAFGELILTTTVAPIIALLSPITAYYANAKSFSNYRGSYVGSCLTDYWLASVALYGTFAAALTYAAAHVFARFRMENR
jgi:ABC-type transport system involved in multi-copper enzyme maturation permease subunit